MNDVMKEVSPCLNCSKNRFCDERGLYETCEKLAAWNRGDVEDLAKLDVVDMVVDEDNSYKDEENLVPTIKDQDYVRAVKGERLEGTKCATEGCEREVWAKGLCNACYSKERKRKIKEEEKKVKEKKPPMNETICSVEGCNNMARAKGLCINHYNKELGIDKLHVAFPKDSNILAMTRKIAEIEFRTMNAQIIYFISRGIEKWVAENKERARAVHIIKRGER